MASKSKKTARQTKRYRIRSKINGTSDIPRLSIFKSNTAIYAQLIDDDSGKTLVSSSTKVLKLEKKNISSASAVGKDIAKKAKKIGVTKIVFDRSGYVYHGKVKAFAEAARKEGLKF